MAILHKNISASADIHVPKWLPSANNGDYAFKNEKGELESIDELLLPGALNFVDGSVAPPTTSTGDIYILSSGASVNAGWGSVALQDWVRYDGTAWNSLTPQKSSLCYDKTADSLKFFDGSAWAAIGGGGGGGGNTIYTSDDTILTNRIATLTDTVTFKSGTIKSQGLNTLSSASALQVYDGDGTPNLLWDFKNNGDLIGNKAKIELTAQNTISNDITESVFLIEKLTGANLINIANDGYFHLGDANSINGLGGVNLDFSTCFQVGHNNSISANNGSSKVNIGTGNSNTSTSINQVSVGIGNTISGGFADVLVFGLGNTGRGRDNILVGQYINGGTGKYVAAVGNGLTFAGEGSSAIASLSNITSNYSGVLGFALESSAVGAFVIGYGSSADFTQKLVNNTTNSLALGWNSTTPQHLFKSTGVNLTLPTSSAGLVSGDLYNDSGTVKIV